MKKIVKYPLTLLALTFHNSGRALVNIAKIFYRLIEERPIDIHTFHPDCDDYASKRQIEEKRKIEEENELSGKYKDWTEAAENATRTETIRAMFEEMKQYELDYFKQFCISELEKDKDILYFIAGIIGESQQYLHAAEMDVQLEMYCETSHVFAFLFNKLYAAVSVDTYPSLTAKTFRYKHGLSEEFVAGYDYEIKRRFALELEKELPQHETTKPKRTKI